MDNKTYQEELIVAMNMLGRKGYFFIGQTVEYPGSPMFKSLKEVSMVQRKEMPVFENTQLGMSIGMTLNGIKVCSIFPRIDFLICAVDQLVNHLDKIKAMSKSEFEPAIIIRTQLGNTKPLDPGPQHRGDYTEGLKKMLKNVKVIKVKNPIKDYQIAIDLADQGISTIMIDKPTGVWKA